MREAVETQGGVVVNTAADVIAGRCKFAVEEADNLDWMRTLPDGCVSLTVCSPPYSAARTYGVGFALQGQGWVDWMIPRVVEMCRATAGLVCINMAGQRIDHKYQPVVEWLVADLTRHHGVVCGPAPYVFYRFGIPGSGGSHYHRRDWEPCYVFCRPEVLPLAWSANTAEGHPPKWAPGGEMSNRLKTGDRVGKFGSGGRTSIGRKPGGEMAPPSQSSIREDVVVGNDTTQSFIPDVTPEDPTHHPLIPRGGTGVPRANGKRREHGKPRKVVTQPRDGQHSQESTTYDESAIANPGNVICDHYNAEQVRQLLDAYVTREIEYGDVIRCLVGGGVMGSPLAHKNEAAFPLRLPEFFIRSYAKPDSIVLDPFCGSGTTGHAAIIHGRRFVGCDVRASQAELSRNRLSGLTPSLFGGES